MRVIAIILMFVAIIYAYVDGSTDEIYPGVPQFPAYRFKTYVDSRDGNEYHILSVRKYLYNGQYAGDILVPSVNGKWRKFDEFVEFNIFTENLRFKTKKSVDTLGEQFYPKSDVASACPEGWQVASNVAQGGILIRNDSIFISLLPSRNNLPDTAFSYKNVGYFIDSGHYVAGSNRFWANDSIIHATMMVGFEDSNDFALINEYLEQYPIDADGQYLSIRCMKTSDERYQPVFTTTYSAGLERSFVESWLWDMVESK